MVSLGILVMLALIWHRSDRGPKQDDSPPKAQGQDKDADGEGFASENPVLEGELSEGVVTDEAASNENALKSNASEVATTDEAAANGNVLKNNASEAATTGDDASSPRTETKNMDHEELSGEYDRQKLQQILSGMTTEEKVCQLFFVTPEQLVGVDTVTAAGSATQEAYEKYPVGGLVYFAANLQNREQTREMLEKTAAIAEERMSLPVFLGVDEEGGRVTRIASNPAFGVQEACPMEQMADEDEARQAGSTIGAYLKQLGFNMDFAPVADVLTNPENTVISDRSFGSDPGRVCRLAAAYSDGLHNSGILSTYKHFPGHGATSGDTHQGYAYTDKTYEQLKESELKPFLRAGEDGADFVMAAHIAAPAVTGSDIPCSLSEKMLTEILRDDLGYDGIVITDALNMGAIVNDYSSGQAAVRAFSAGADMLLMPADFKSAYEAMLQAVRNGEIAAERLDMSVARIIRTKLRQVS